ncbi:MAG: hypothetical protein GXP63_01255, partial [DPANN group archaeon]|nr:hypothetical protein [DPANN group archaeon]
SLHRDIPAFMQYRKAGELTLWNWLKTITPPITMNDLPLSDPTFVLANAWLMSKGFVQKLGKS